jgi:hypothetical protein
MKVHTRIAIASIMLTILPSAVWAQNRNLYQIETTRDAYDRQQSAQYQWNQRNPTSFGPAPQSLGDSTVYRNTDRYGQNSYSLTPVPQYQNQDYGSHNGRR